MYRILFFTTFFIFTLLLTACGGDAPKPNTNGTNGANANPVANNNAGIATTSRDKGPTVNDAPTLGPVVRAYYEALKKKDDALLRTTLSQEMIRQTEADMKEEKKTGLAAYMAETEKIPENGIEVRNEKIEGDKGIAEIKGGNYVTWIAIAFVKEGGVWKRTNGGPEMDLKSSAPSSNTAK